MAAHKFQQFWAEELRGTIKSVNESHETTTAAEEEAIFAEIPVDGLKSDVVFSIIRKRMSEEPDLVKAFKFVIQFNITRNGKVVAVWSTRPEIIQR